MKRRSSPIRLGDLRIYRYIRSGSDQRALYIVTSIDISNGGYIGTVLTHGAPGGYSVGYRMRAFSHDELISRGIDGT